MPSVLHHPDPTLQLLEAQLEDLERGEADARRSLATATGARPIEYLHWMILIQQAQERRRRILALIDEVSLHCPGAAGPVG